METDVAVIKETLRKRGYSEKAIEEILKWYGFSNKKTRRVTN